MLVAIMAIMVIKKMTNPLCKWAVIAP